MPDAPEPAEFSQKVVFKKGGLWEEPEWEIHYDRRIHNSSPTCPHCKPTGNKQYPFTCPQVVVASNEGGYNSTGICLDCLLGEVVPPEDEDNGG